MAPTPRLALNRRMMEILLYVLREVNRDAEFGAQSAIPANLTWNGTQLYGFDGDRFSEE